MPKNLTDLKRSKKEKKDSDIAIDTSREDYSYGLRVDLNDEEITKLGIPLPDVGASMVIVAQAKVISVRESADTNGKDRNIELQITKMKLEPYKEEDSKKAVIEKLYPE